MRVKQAIPAEDGATHSDIDAHLDGKSLRQQRKTSWTNMKHGYSLQGNQNQARARRLDGKSTWRTTIDNPLCTLRCIRPPLPKASSLLRADYLLCDNELDKQNIDRGRAMRGGNAA